MTLRQTLRPSYSASNRYIISLFCFIILYNYAEAEGTYALHSWVTPDGQMDERKRVKPVRNLTAVYRLPELTLGAF